MKIPLILIVAFFLTAQGNGIIDFLSGLSEGYNIGASCTTSLANIETYWTEFVDSIPTSKGSGNSLIEFHDFTLGITQAATSCSFLQLANSIDSAFTSNLLATLIRLFATYQKSMDALSQFFIAFQNGDYLYSGNQFGLFLVNILGS